MDQETPEAEARQVLQGYLDGGAPREYATWWALRHYLRRQLTHEEFLDALRRFKQPLRLFLNPAPDHGIAFDVRPDWELMRLIGDVHHNLCSSATLTAVKDALRKDRLARGEQIEVGNRHSESRRAMREARTQLLAAGKINNTMTIEAQHFAVLKHPGIAERTQGYGYEIFRRDCRGEG